MTLEDKLQRALGAYGERTGHCVDTPVAVVLFDMDGVLYDSMPGHAIAWEIMCRENGIECEPNEFFGYEGMTGAATIDLLIRRAFGRPATAEEAKRLYARKSELFAAQGTPVIMPGAQKAVAEVVGHGAKCVLVTGSGQGSLLTRLDKDYDGAFSLRVTAYDVTHGKPDPEPFLVGLRKAEVGAARAVAVDNAPLGVKSASSASIFTIGVRTGPLPEGALAAAGADIEVDSMFDCTILLARLL